MSVERSAYLGFLVLEWPLVEEGHRNSYEKKAHKWYILIVSEV